jgi:hypothetical protein
MKKGAMIDLYTEFVIQGSLLLNDAAQRFYRFPRGLPFRVSIWPDGQQSSPCIVNGASMIEIGSSCVVEVVIAGQGQFGETQAGSLLFVGVYPERIGTLTVMEIRHS